MSKARKPTAARRPRAETSPYLKLQSLGTLMQHLETARAELRWLRDKKPVETKTYTANLEKLFDAAASVHKELSAERDRLRKVGI